MKVLGRWSLVSYMKVLVDVAYFGLLLLVALACVLALVTAVTSGGKSGVQFEVPVRFDLAEASHPFSTDLSDVEAATISEAGGKLTVRGGAASMGLVLAGLGSAVVFLVTALFILGRLRGVFRTLKDENPFVAQNSSRIRLIGLALIVGEVATAGLAAILAARATSEISIEGVAFRNGLALDAWPLFAGLVLIVLAEIFRLGAQMKGDLETARKIQFDLVPGERFEKRDVVVQARMRPARSVGGDYYDVFELDDGHLAVVVGDVAGKGLPAALLMTSIVGSVRALLSAGLRGCELIAALNRHVCANTSGGRFVTLFYGELDVDAGRLTYVNAGHNPPYLLRADGREERLEPTAMVLGVMPEAAVEAQQALLMPADRLLLFTDGLSEAFNAKEEEYGETRLRDSLARSLSLPPAAAIERLTADVLSFCGRVPLRDDMTLMLVARAPA